MAKDVEEDLLGDEGIQRKTVKRWLLGNSGGGGSLLSFRPNLRFSKSQNDFG